MALKADPVDRRFDGAVDQLHHEGEQHRRDEQRPLDSRMAEPHGQGYDDYRESKFLAEGRFLAERAPQSPDARAQGTPHTRGAPGLESIDDYAVGFHLKSS